MRIHRTLALGASLLVLLSACATGGGGTQRTSGPASAPASVTPSVAGGGTITIGSAGFYESGLMAEIYAQALEAHGFTVERNFDIGPRPQTFAALEAGDDFDMMPEYIGSTLEFVNQGAGEATADSAATAEKLQERLTEKGLTVLGYTEAQDKNGFVVRQDTADESSLAKMSDLAAVQTELKWGLPPECETNPLCGGALEEYGIDFDQIDITELAACDVPIATALDEGGIDIAELCTTQPAIATFGFVLLEDDKETQPAENIAPIVTDEWLDANGGKDALAAILDPVSEAMTTEMLTQLGVRVAVEQEDREDVATDWLTENGLLPEG